ncbi:MAG TPA: mechanosensitive ion channel family protein [Pyrinomonadaceae bacterium]|nr:mechanosensitive ion channel family protein [Pyrinomonadaceae bacterium]
MAANPQGTTEQVEELKQHEDVKRALKQTAGVQQPQEPVEVKTKEKVFIGTYVLLLVSLGGLYYLLSLGVLTFGFASRYVPFLQRATRGAMLVVLVLALEQLVAVYLIGRLDDAVPRYNLKRIVRLFVVLLIILIAFSVIFVTWYTTLFSLGVISFILGFALQAPGTSFLGWIYILVRAPYRVGDRIKIGSATGDVIDVSYLDTTLWEFGGDLLSSDHPSGRVIKFPNSNVLNTSVFNYSWPLFPYVWNEIKFQVAYNSDLEFIATTMQEVVEEELGEAMMERVKIFRDLLAQTPVDQLQVRERPSVLFRVSDNTWLEAIVRYVVPPREAGRIKTALIKKLLEKLNEEPEKVCFPKGNMR